MTMDFTVLWLIMYPWCVYADCEELLVENGKICYEIYDADKGSSIWWLARIKCRDGYTLEILPSNTTYPVCRIQTIDGTNNSWKWTNTFENFECVPAEDETTIKPEQDGEDHYLMGVLMPLLIIVLVCVAIGVTLGVFLFGKNSSSMNRVKLESGQNHQEQEQCGDNDAILEADCAVFSIETEEDQRPSHRPYKSVGLLPGKPIHCGLSSMARNNRHTGHVNVHKLRGHKR